MNNRCFLIIIMFVIAACGGSDDNNCNNELDIEITSLEKEYGCVNTKIALGINLTDDFVVIDSQSDFDAKVVGNCVSTIDFLKYDLIIGKKGLQSGNSSIDYELIENCESNGLSLKVIFNQNIATVAPTLTYHALVPKLKEGQQVKVVIEVKY